MASNDLIDASDLLDPETGKVDHAKVRARAQDGVADGEVVIDATECAALRTRLADGDETIDVVADAFGIATTTARRHARGRCQHNIETPAVGFDRNRYVWEVRDE